MENVNLNQIVEDIRAQLPPPRADGSRRKIMFTKREDALLDMIRALLDHVQLYDGARELSKNLCAGCSRDRTRICPVPTAFTALEELGVPYDPS